MTITATRIRGEPSLGMLCAADEIGLSKDHTGLYELPAATLPGTPLVDILGSPDTVLDLEITWNRPDCLSLIGMAREVAALYGLPLRRPVVEYPETGPDVSTLTDVALEDALACPRYTARVVQGVRSGASPVWMQRRLERAGVRAISLVVDVTNYVMLECGHPLHAFDYHRLGGNRIVVRRARPGERIRTLDGVDRVLDPEVLVIADAERAVAVAGIMGGEGSEIGDSTGTVLLEAATFDPVRTHASVVRLGLSTESGYRYERRVDAAGVDWASRRAISLLVSEGGGTAARGVIDRYPAPVDKRRLWCRFDKVNQLLGFDVPPERVRSILESLEFSISAVRPDALEVTVPTFRNDVEETADLIEEISRVHGLDAVPTVVPVAVRVEGADDPATRARERVRQIMVGMGFSEIMHYSFLSAGELDRFDRDDAPGRVVLPNPVSADFDVLRHHLVPQITGTLGRNYTRQVRAARFFEMGRIFRKDPLSGGLSEADRIGIGIMGPASGSGLQGKRAVTSEAMMLQLKGAVVALCEASGLSRVDLAPVSIPWFETGWGFEVKADGNPLGTLGLIRGTIRKIWKITEPVGVAELDLDPLLAVVGTTRRIQPVPAYPAVERDVALVVDESVLHGDIVQTIWKQAPKELIRVDLFDIFRSEGVGHGRKSMAYSLVYRSTERTLTDEEANGFHEAIKQGLRTGLKAEIREG